MKIQIEFEEKEKISELDKREIKTKISIITNLLGKKIPSFIKFLDDQTKKGEYLEINYPLFQYDITIMISKIKQKYLISVLNHNNTLIYGNLILDSLPCIHINELSTFGDWSNYNIEKKLRIFKPL